MVAVNEDVITEATERGETLLVKELLELIERAHPHDRPGIAWETLETYAEHLENADGRQQYDAAGLLETVEQRLDGDGDDAESFYRLDDGRVSAYPARWHDELGGETDLREYVRFLTEAETDAELGGNGGGVPEQVLLDVASTVGRIDRAAAKDRLEELRDRDDLVEDADQHPNARIRLPENADEQRNPRVDS